MHIRKFIIMAYVIRKYFQGYTLLKNPQGTPWTSVKMLETLHFISTETLDVTNSYFVISADFSGSKKKEIKESLHCTKHAFFDSSTKQLTYSDKEIYYAKMGDTPYVFADKGEISFDVLNARNLDYIDSPVARIKENFVHTGFLGMPLGITTIERDKTLGEYVIDNFHKKKDKAEIDRLQFHSGLFKTLYHNLSR